MSDLGPYCPNCGSEQSIVRETRTRFAGGERFIWRRRECTRCQTRFSTGEVAWALVMEVTSDDQ